MKIERGTARNSHFTRERFYPPNRRATEGHYADKISVFAVARLIRTLLKILFTPELICSLLSA